MHPSPHIEVKQADLSVPEHQQAIVELVNAYAMDPMGNGSPLPREVREALIPGLRKHPTTMVFLAWERANGMDGGAGRTPRGADSGAQAVGVAVCFLGFSTFAAKPLINIHDLAVLPTHRGKGIGGLLLAEVERKARSLGCCKLTLEVLENNTGARKLYEAFGFAQAVYQEAAGGALFLSKPLKGH
jgi:ribosomal protein S18 acetylase RimI-like enzyme